MSEPSDTTSKPKPEASEEEATAVEEEVKQEEPTLEEKEEGSKRSREDANEPEDEGPKKQKTAESKHEVAPVPASMVGLSSFNDADVLSGRGGGTNVHPGNRTFRELINLHRRAYLKARKNDKPAISRTIVRTIRENNGRFLKKDDKTGLWFEIGDDAAREKTSQALRQRAPEMRKLLFETERDEARHAAEEHLRQQRMMMGMQPEAMQAAMANMGAANPMAFPNPAFLMANFPTNGKIPIAPANPEAYQHMYAGMMGNPMGGGPSPAGGSNPAPNSGNNAARLAPSNNTDA